MPKYQNAYFDDLYKDDEDADFMSQDPAQEQPNEDTPAAQEPATNGADWEKRYGDLRRHSQAKQDELMRRIDALENQVESATKEQIKFPKTEDEIKAWSEKYPEVAAVVDTIARMRASEVVSETEKRLDKLREKEERQTKATAYEKLLEKHPDFEDIKTTSDFTDWVSEQPQYIFDALYKNATDVRAAARAIDLYKVDKGMAKAPKADTSKDAARDVAAGGSTSPKSSDKPKWSDSKVKALSDADYDKYEAEIEEAMRNGNYVYDL